MYFVSKKKTEYLKSDVKHDLKYFVKRYIQEFFEAITGLFVVILLLKQKFTIYEIIRISAIIGLVTLILEEYNLEYANNVKQGLYFTIGAMTLNVVS